MTDNNKLPALSEIHTIVFDFDGVFTDNKVWVNELGQECVCCDRGDGLGVDMLLAAQRLDLLQADVLIVTSEHNPVATRRADKLGLVCHQGVRNKLEFLQTLLEQRFPESGDRFSGLVYLGNDLNDLAVMQRAGFAVAPLDAHTRVQRAASLVVQQAGGKGFVRTFIELLLRCEQLSEDEIHELISSR